MKYLFPRQFGMHNVFTCTVDPKESIQPFKDYTLREQEIAQSERSNTQKRSAGTSSTAVKQRVPKRLRGEALDLVRKMQRLHSRCSYHDLLKHYCPSERIGPRPKLIMLAQPAKVTPERLDTQGPDLLSCSSTDAAAPQTRVEPPKTPLVSLATPHSNVSAFCQAVISNLVPNGFWGKGIQGQENRKVVIQNIDRFVRLRRFESLSLHAVSQGLKVRRFEDQKLRLKLTLAVDIYDLVEPGSCQPIYEGCSFRHSEAQRDYARIPLLRVRLPTDTTDPLQFSRHRIECSPEPSFLFSTRYMAGVDRARNSGLQIQYVRRDQDCESQKVARRTTLGFQSNQTPP